MTNDQLREEKRLELERIEIKFYHGLGIATLFGLVVIPLIPASLTFMAIGTQFPTILHIPHWLAWPIAFFAGAGIEFLGLGAIKLALQQRKYNITLAKEQMKLEHAPLEQGAAVAIAYVIVVLSLTVILKMYPQFAIWSLIPLALMGALVDWYFALKGDQEDREAKLRKLHIAQVGEEDRMQETQKLRDAVATLRTEKTQLREDLQRAQAQYETKLAQLQTEIAQAKAKPTPAKATQTPQGETEIDTELNDTQLAIVREIHSNPEITQADIADAIGKTPGTVSRALSPLKKSGAVLSVDDEWKIAPELINTLNGSLTKG